MPLNTIEAGQRDAAYKAYQNAKRNLEAALQNEAAAWALEYFKAKERKESEGKKP